MDLITGGDESPVVVRLEDAQPDEVVNEDVGPDERLEGRIVKVLWKRSGLAKERLKEIWYVSVLAVCLSYTYLVICRSECDVTYQGSLDREGFVRGMWRIDEELRRAQSQALKSASAVSLGSIRMKQSPLVSFAAPKLPQRPRDLLR